MNTLIVFATKYGTAATCARKLSGRMEGETAVCELPLSEKKGSLEGYDAVVIGGSIYAGKIHSQIPRFCQENLETLLEKNVGLFICCLDEDRIEEQMEDAFPAELLEHATCRGYFGYTLPYEKMNVLMRLIVKMITKKKESESNIIEENIERFASEMAGK